MHTTLKYLAAMAACTLFATSASAQSAKDIRGPSPLVAIENEAPAKLIVDPPLPEPLARGLVFIQYRTENLRVVPVFGKGAREVSPRIGHIHITVDDAPWHFVDASGETVIVVGLKPGPHKVLIELADPTHRVLTSETVKFTLPDPKTPQTVPAADTEASVISLLPANLRAATEANAVRPFRINVPEEALVDLRRRVAATRWPDRETVTDQSQGVPLAKIQELVRYWGTDYDWRKVETKLNALPQFVTEIDGLDIQFVHVRSRHPNALPLIITHGWPGSILELLKVIGPLTDPTAYGGRAEDAFDLVLPSMPGYGFSGKPQGTGWGPDRIARAWAELMGRLGYKRYVSQGGDWGSVVSHAMARQAPVGLLGIHVNMPATVPSEIAKLLTNGEPAPSDLSDAEKAAFESLDTFYKKNTGYSAMMVTRPQTVGYGLADSPAGQAAWIYDKFAAWTYSGGEPERSLTKDEMLDDITLYWLTNSATSSAQLYWENNANNFNAVDISMPVGVTVFPGEIYRAPRSWAERTYHKLIYWNEVDKGGHFAAWEEPELFATEIRAAFRSLR